MHMPGANRILLPRSSTIRFQRGWVTGTPGRRNALGRMIPQPTVFDRQGREHRFDDLVGSGFVVIGADADLRDSMTAHQVAAWAALGARFVTVRRSFSTADATGLDVPAPRGNLDRTTSATSHAPAPSPTPIRA